MNKFERMGVVALFGFLLLWSFYGRQTQPDRETTVPAVTDAVETSEVAVTDDTLPERDMDALDEEVEKVERTAEEVTYTLSNDLMDLVFSSWGGGVSSVSLRDYRATIDPDSGPITFDFGHRITLGYRGIPGLSVNNDFELVSSSRDNELEIRGERADRLALTRTFVLDDGYAVDVTDLFENRGDTPIAIRGAWLQIGPMVDVERAPGGMGGMAYLGVDVRHSADQKVEHFAKQLPRLFGVRGGCSRPDLRGLPVYIEESIAGEFDWVAVKNKFFTQILSPEDDVIPGARLRVGRENLTDRFHLHSVSAALAVPDLVLEPGERVERRYRYYAGPKKYSRLRAEGDDRSEIMEFGRFFKPVCKVLLPLLNGIERWIPGGYGVAIIVLTIIVKLVFWPVTHKGTESMKRMQKLQPELKKLREKYKKDPKKLQEKQMLLYREHKVNPLAGCLPMVIQIPVFIGLFTVLRSAVELRFTRFLWISDLSEPEGLLAGVLPFPAGGLNLLPLLMTATMVLQQKLTPSAGDPQQQKMMAFMPVMMLFIFYNMPSALVLYWTVSQLLSILQLVLQQRKDQQLRKAVPA